MDLTSEKLVLCVWGGEFRGRKGSQPSWIKKECSGVCYLPWIVTKPVWTFKVFGMLFKIQVSGPSCEPDDSVSLAWHLKYTLLTSSPGSSSLVWQYPHSGAIGKCHQGPQGAHSPKVGIDWEDWDLREKKGGGSSSEKPGCVPDTFKLFYIVLIFK